MDLLKRNFGTVLKEYALISLGVLCYVTSWSVFLMPHNFVGGGVTGISAIIHYATKGSIGVGTTYFLINLVLLGIGLKVLGKSFSGKTIYAMLLASLAFEVIPNLIPHEFIQEFVLSNGKMLCALIGGSIVGASIGLAFSQGGSTGGTDIIVLIVTKKYNVSPGRMVMLIDSVIILSALFVPSFDADGNALSAAARFATVVYGFIIVAVDGYSTDLMLSGARQSIQVMIFSQKYKEIADAIAYDFKRGVTLLHAQGWFTKTEKDVLLVITRRRDITMLLRYIKVLDPDAFVYVTNVSNVFGEGFEHFKEKGRKLSEREKTRISGQEENPF
ncbi:MAG: YitT family protein [Bacteroidales bacterium]|nr:YitT family protein [Bacteroidales bacterium]